MNCLDSNIEEEDIRDDEDMFLHDYAVESISVDWIKARELYNKLKSKKTEYKIDNN